MAERSWNSHVKSIWTPSNSRVTSYSQSHDGILPGTHWILIVGGLRNTSNCGLPGQVQWSRRATWYKGAAASMHYVTKESNKNRRTPHPVPIPSPNDCISHISFSGSGCSHYAHEGLSRFGVPRLRFETENYTFLQTCLANTASKDDQIWYLHISFANCSYNDPILSRYIEHVLNCASYISDMSSVFSAQRLAERLARFQQLPARSQQTQDVSAFLCVTSCLCLRLGIKIVCNPMPCSKIV